LFQSQALFFTKVLNKFEAIDQSLERTFGIGIIHLNLLHILRVCFLCLGSQEEFQIKIIIILENPIRSREVIINFNVLVTIEEPFQRSEIIQFGLIHIGEILSNPKWLITHLTRNRQMGVVYSFLEVSH
jgi:hypothetical protein